MIHKLFRNSLLRCVKLSSPRCQSGMDCIVGSIPIVNGSMPKLIAERTTMLIVTRQFDKRRVVYEKPDVITIPKYMEKRMKVVRAKVRQREEEKIERRKRTGYRDVPIITCRFNPELNHYLGQTYDHLKKVPLCSQGWRLNKYTGDMITFHPHTELNPALETGPYERSFEPFGLHASVLEGMASFGIEKPTLIQSRAIPEILDNQHVICSSETGSGKTFAYLAPIMHMMRATKAFHNETHPRTNNPLALIITPSRELAEQVGRVAHQLGRFTGLGVATMIGGPPSGLRQTGLDMVITTAGMINPLLKKRVFHLRGLRHLVLDEADTLLDDSFSDMVLDIFESLLFMGSESPMGAQLILVSATMPNNIKEVLGDFMDVEAMTRVTTPALHHVLPNIKHVFMRTGKRERDEKLLELVKQDIAEKRPVMIFSNMTKACKWVHKFLTDHGIECLRLHKSMDSEKRKDQFKKFQLEECDVISCTDLGSRGLDTTRVRHVINFECPHYVSDYIHRAGRTGRVGSQKGCKVSSFVCFEPDVKLLQALEMAIRGGMEINAVDANIKNQIQKRKEEKIARAEGKL